jgi:alpha-L-rhamnosidase
MYEMFLDTIRAEQSVETGNLPVNVPAHSPGKPMDISWTAAYPLIAHWLWQYYGDLGVVREHWPTLKLFVDGQRAQMKGTGVPNFFNFGDWCAIESRAVCTPNTGPPAAAANYILSVEAMGAMAQALGEDADHAKYISWLDTYRTEYHDTYYNAALESYGKTDLEIQTMSAVALGASAVPPGKQSDVIGALIADIESRDHHLTVGATGQKWLLRMLTAKGGAAGHDTALKLAAQDSFPGWGYWVSQGATTCWESWPGVQGPSHPGVRGRPINPPTHNHIFLCGGVGAWMFRSLGGISPASPGYGAVTIAPQISPTLDPSSCNASVVTVRGEVKSSWVRQSDVTSDGTLPAACSSTTSGAKGAVILKMQITVPVGMLGHVHVPLLGYTSSRVKVDAVLAAGPWASTVAVWDGGKTGAAEAHAGTSAWLLALPWEKDEALVLEVAAVHQLELQLSVLC